MLIHTRYDTVNHHHLDYLLDNGEYPDSGLMLIECCDGRWFILQEFGDEYSRFPGVVCSREDDVTEPVFYPDLEAAARAAFGFIGEVYPSDELEKLLADLLDDE
ncbi:hypothetical protein [Klebsiella pneumoniae]|uniref:hypothetical protein n=1 Tax=Klebsiella pneumoniae TaxID=573 RepID=UPI0013305720|nr:hypothetical protein [Klebsiella pneumoniae]